MLTLRTDFTTDFHRQLATPEWMELLHETVENLVAPWRNFEGSIHAHYVQPKYLTPENELKYLYEVNVKQTLPADCALQRSLTICLNYLAEAPRFELKDLSTSYRVRAFNSQAQIEQCRQLGLLGELPDWTRLGPDLANDWAGAREMAFDMNVVPLGVRDNIWWLGMTDLGSLTRWQGRYLPVLLTEDQLQEARFRIFGGRIEVEQVDVNLVSMPPESPSFQSIGEPTLELTWFRPLEPITLKLSPTHIRLSLEGRHLIRPISTQLYVELQAGGRNALTVSYPGQGRSGLDGQHWTLDLEGQSRTEWEPYSGPFLDFCVKLLEAAGVVLNLTRRPGVI